MMAGVCVMKKTKTKKHKTIFESLTYAYIRKIKKWMFCPACQNGKMSINKKSTLWTCEECGYKLSADEFEDDYVFWFCDECNSYLNNQEEFDRHASRHICKKCGYENDTTFDNLKGICTDCGKIIPDPDGTLCVDCRQIRRQKAKERLITAGKVVGVVAAVAGTAYLASQSDGNESVGYIPHTSGDDDDEGETTMRFGYVTDYWMETASEDELRSVEDEMRAELDSLDYDSDEYLQLDLKRIDVVNAIASRFPLNLPHREHGWYLSNDD